MNRNQNIKILDLDKNLDNKKKNKLKKIIIPIIAILILSTIALLNISKTNNFVKTGTEKLFTNAGIYTKEKRNIEITSNDYDNPRSWKINKSVKWIDNKRVKVSYDLTSIADYPKDDKDVVLMIDTSKSMSDGKLEQIKTNTIKLIDEILKEKNNRVAIITFNEQAELLSNYTNDKTTLIENISSLSISGASDYKESYKLLNEFLKENNDKEKETSILFIVGGYSNIKVNKTLYNVLKRNYSNIIINGIQYEMGNNTDELSKCTDKQIIANESNLYEKLNESLFPVYTYDTFMIDDHISNDFTVSDKNDITITNGNINIYNKDKTIITWDLTDTYVVGSHEKMEIIATVKSDNTKEGYYPVSNKTQIQTETDNVVSTESLVLKNYYEVNYDANTPNGCKIDNPKSQKYLVYTGVTNNKQLSCDGYLFKGWEAIQNVEKVNDNTFIMPEEDVLVRGTWTKQNITKTMEGEVYEKTTLYKAIKDRVDEKKSVVLKYDGEHNDSIDENKSIEDIYYFYAENDKDVDKVNEKNNVLFADICWKIVRTTDTGGVKLIYNGKPDKNGTCSDERDNQLGYDVRIIQQLADNNYYYGTSYTYDEENKIFKLSKDIIQLKWNNVTYTDILGKYTCLSDKEEDTCTNIYYVESPINEEQAYIIPINSNTNHTIIGISNYNKLNDSLAYTGYMYGDTYNYSKIKLVEKENLTTNEQITEDEIIIGDSIVDNKGIYMIEEPKKITKEEWNNNFKNYIGKYTCNSTITQCNNPRIIINASINGYNYVNVNEKITISKERKDKTLINPQIVYKYDLLINNDKYSDYKYTCNSENTKCNDIRYIKSIKDNGYEYVNNYYFGEDITWNGKKYVLQNPVEMEKYNEISNNHYMCIDINNKECKQVAYIYYLDENNIAYYILLDGKVSNIDEAIKSMTNNNINDSEIKRIIEIWYEKNILNYQEYLEDTIYCNKRTIINSEVNGWNKKGNLNEIIKFNNQEDKIDLKCKNPTDQFSINNDLAKIKYQVGLMTKDEAELLNNDNLRKTDQSYWLSSPYSYKDIAKQYQVKEDGTIDNIDSSHNSGIRPVITLKSKIEFIEGNGSKETPYVIEEKEN